jgi:hypothetical protein
MWNTGDKEMPPYGETVMYKLARGKKVEEGICFLDRTDGGGHHFEKIAVMSHGGDKKQPHIHFTEGDFSIEESEKKLFVWYNMIPLNQAGLSQAELIRQPNEE